MGYRKAYTAPPNAVYNHAKKKERCTKAINLIKLLLADSNEEGLKIALKNLENYKTKLTTV